MHLCAVNCTQAPCICGHSCTMQAAAATHLDAANLQQKCSQASRQVQQLRGLAGVKHADEKQAKVLLQPVHVRVSAMKDLQYSCIGKGPCQSCSDVWSESKSINDVVPSPSGDLHQACEPLKGPARCCACQHSVVCMSALCCVHVRSCAAFSGPFTFHSFTMDSPLESPQGEYKDRMPHISVNAGT
jgi:hypothetical protein